jgi:hypothetical protein
LRASAPSFCSLYWLTCASRQAISERVVSCLARGGAGGVGRGRRRGTGQAEWAAMEARVGAEMGQVMSGARSGRTRARTERHRQAHAHTAPEGWAGGGERGSGAAQSRQAGSKQGRPERCEPSLGRARWRVRAVAQSGAQWRGSERERARREERARGEGSCA